MMLEAADMFLPPYCSPIQRGRGTTPHFFLQSAATRVKFHGCDSNISFTPSLHIGITISVQLCINHNHRSLLFYPDIVLPIRVVCSPCRRRQRRKRSKSLFMPCETYISNNSSSIKQRAVKFACNMGFSAIAEQMV